MDIPIIDDKSKKIPQTIKSKPNLMLIIFNRNDNPLNWYSSRSLKMLQLFQILNEYPLI